MVKAWAKTLVQILRRDWVLDFLVAISLGVMVLAIRTWLGEQRWQLPAGDTFNFIRGADFLLQGQWPPDEKRLPAYSLLIALARFFVLDPVEAARAVVVICSSLALVTGYYLGRALNIARIPLAAMLLLAAVDRTLALYGVRALSQGVFILTLVLALYAVVRLRPIFLLQLVAGAAVTAAALTRLEGLVLAPILLLLGRLYVQWRGVMLVALAAILAFLPWLIVVERSTGSAWYWPGQDAYVLEIASGQRGTLDPSAVFRGLLTITEETWALLWKSDILFENPVWWVAVVALVGLGWLFVTQPRHMAVILAGFFTVVVIAAWYRPSNKYAFPHILLWYVAAAGGWTVLGVILSRVSTRPRWLGKSLASGAALLVMAVHFQSQLFSTWNLIRTGQGEGVALYQAVTFVREAEGLVAFSHVSSLIRTYLGEYGYTNSPPQRALYFAHVLRQPLTTQLQHFEKRKPVWIIDDGAEGWRAMVTSLQRDGRLEMAKAFLVYVPSRDEYDRVVVWQVLK